MTREDEIERKRKRAAKSTIPIQDLFKKQRRANEAAANATRQPSPQAGSALQVDNEAPTNESEPESRLEGQSIQNESSSLHMEPTSTECAPSNQGDQSGPHLEPASPTLPETRHIDCRSSNVDRDEQSIPVGNCPVNSLNLFNDLGRVINATMKTNEVKSVVDTLSDAQKYKLIKDHYVPPESYIFPVVYHKKCYRRFNPAWLDTHPWLVYSPSIDGAFCKFCALFAPSDKRHMYGTLVNVPWSKWGSYTDNVVSHPSKGYHTQSVEACKRLIATMDTPSATIPYQIDTTAARRAQENKHIVGEIARAVLFCARQCIGLRGHYSANDASNPGNFLALLKMMAERDPILKSHLEHPRLKNATYLSGTSQNEIIQIEAGMVERSVVGEIQLARFYGVMTDEITIHNREQLPLCVRFVDKERNIREEFLRLFTVHRITGQVIGRHLLQNLESLSLDPHLVRFLGMDGAPNMSSEEVGVVSVVRETQPLATYNHCGNHCLNLTITHACALPVIRNALAKFKELVLFFTYSPKREGLLRHIFQSDEPDAKILKILLKLCFTRWVQRHDGYRRFKQALKHIIRALEIIVYGIQAHDFGYDPEITDGWDSDTKKAALAHINAIANFEFLITFMWMEAMLTHLEGTAVKLQKKTIDIYDAYQTIDIVMNGLKDCRENVDQEFKAVYQMTVAKAYSIGVEPAKPRITTLQKHRANAKSARATSSADTASTIEDHFRINMAIPFLDHLLKELKEQFKGLNGKAATLIGLVPSVLCERNIDVSAAAKQYEEDLPSPDLVDFELKRWKAQHQDMDPDMRPDSCAKALKCCDPDLYPNLSVLLQLACTLPVTSCECERSGSTLRRLSNYMRGSMGQERLSGLALLHTHYDFPIDIEKVVQEFFRLHPRRLHIDTVLLS